MRSHEYQKLPLASVEEFLAKHPQYADADENALMAARIEDERAEREALEQQRQELLKRKQKLIAENKKRREDLANLDNDLEKFIDVCYSIADCGRSPPRIVVLIRSYRRQNPSRRLSRRSSELATHICQEIFHKYRAEFMSCGLVLPLELKSIFKDRGRVAPCTQMLAGLLCECRRYMTGDQQLVTGLHTNHRIRTTSNESRSYRKTQGVPSKVKFHGLRRPRKAHQRLRRGPEYSHGGLLLGRI